MRDANAAARLWCAEVNAATLSEICSPMEAVNDSGGRIVLPKQLRDALGLVPGSKVDISAYGGGPQVIPGGRTARLERAEDGRLVANADTAVSDEMMFAIIDCGRR